MRGPLDPGQNRAGKKDIRKVQFWPTRGVDLAFLRPGTLPHDVWKKKGREREGLWQPTMLPIQTAGEEGLGRILETQRTWGEELGKTPVKRVTLRRKIWGLRDEALGTKVRSSRPRAILPSAEQYLHPHLLLPGLPRPRPPHPAPPRGRAPGHLL